MTPTSKPRRDRAALVSLALVGAVVVLAQVAEGGRLRALVQPTAALVVFGGSAAALLLSFPLSQLRRAAIAVRKAFRHLPKSDEALVARFGGKGGGKPDNARGGGKDASKLDEALAKAKSLLG